VISSSIVAVMELKYKKNKKKIKMMEKYYNLKSLLRFSAFLSLKKIFIKAASIYHIHALHLYIPLFFSHVVLTYSKNRSIALYKTFKSYSTILAYTHTDFSHYFILLLLRFNTLSYLFCSVNTNKEYDEEI